MDHGPFSSTPNMNISTACMNILNPCINISGPCSSSIPLPTTFSSQPNKFINSATLAKFLTNETDQPLFVIDCRPVNEFNFLRIKDSIGVLVLPTVIERRVIRGSVCAYMCLQPGHLRNKLMNEKGGGTVIMITDKLNDTGISRSHDQLINSELNQRNGSNSEDEDVCSLLLLKQLRKDGYKTHVLSSSFKSFSSRYPYLCVGTKDSCIKAKTHHPLTIDTVSRPRPSDLGPLVQLEDLKLSVDSSDSCFSSPELTVMKPRGPRSLACSAPVLPSLFDAPPLDDSFPYHEYAKERSCRSNCMEPVQILPYLYLGNAQNSADRSILEKLGIRYILNVTPNLKNWFEEEEQGHFKYLQIPIDDHWSQNLASYFPKAIAFIEEAREQRYGVLVHCVAGISRSVTVTVAYLMQQLGKSMEDAYDIVKQQKPNIAPNFNFMGQLLEFQNELEGKHLDPGFESGSSSGSSSTSKSFHFLDQSPLQEQVKSPLARTQAQSS